MIFKRWYMALLSITVSAVAAAQAASTPALPEHPTFDEIIDRGTLEIAVYENFAPFSYREGGRLVGVDVDLGRMIAEKLGIKAVFRELPAGEKVTDDLRHAIWKGHYLGMPINDLMLHVPSNRMFARQQEHVVISGSYYREKLQLIRDTRSAGDTPNLAAFRYEKIGVELDTLPDFFLSGFNGGMLREKVVHYRSVQQAVDAMRQGEVAAVFAPRSQIEAAMGASVAEFYLIHDVMAPGLSQDSWNLGVAVSTQNRQLGYEIDDLLSNMVENGEIAALFKRHGLTYQPPE